MSRRRRFLARVVRTVSGSPDSNAKDSALDEAALFSCHERAGRASQLSMSTVQTAGAVAAQQRAALDTASDHARLLMTRGRDVRSAAEQVGEALERIKLIALNAGLEGSRLGEAAGRPLVTVADEVRALVVRGSDALEEHLTTLGQVEREREKLREQVEQARQSGGQLADELLRAQSAQREVNLALSEFAEHLQKSTGTDPEVLRAVSEAAQHARGLAATFAGLSSPRQRQSLLRAVGPLLAPLLRLVGEHGELDDPEDL